MTDPRLKALCARCGLTLGEHKQRFERTRPRRLCADGKQYSIPKRVSMSFDDGQVLSLDSALSTLMRGGDARLIARSPGFRSLAQVVGRTRERLAKRKIKAERERLGGGDA